MDPPEPGAELLARENPPRALERTDHHAEERRTPRFVVERVGHPVHQDLVPCPAVYREGDLVAHGAGGEEDRRLLAEELRHAFLQPVGGRVLAALLVPHLRARHRLAHGFGRAGHGVGEEVDHGKNGEEGTGNSEQ